MIVQTTVRRECEGCGAYFTVPRSRGRYPRKGPCCANPATVRKALEGDPGALLRPVALKAIERAGEVPWEHRSRRGLQRAVVLTAHARGHEGLRAALIEVAAVALAWATSVPSRIYDAGEKEAA